MWVSLSKYQTDQHMSTHLVYAFVLVGCSSPSAVLDDVQGMLWSSENEASKGTPPRKLALTDEGNLVIFDRNNVPLWQTHTKGYDNLKSAAAAAALLARH